MLIKLCSFSTVPISPMYVSRLGPVGTWGQGTASPNSPHAHQLRCNVCMCMLCNVHVDTFIGFGTICLHIRILPG